MKRALTALVLIVTIALSGLTPAAAFTSEEIAHGAPSGIAPTEDGGYLMTDVFNKVIWKINADGTVKRAAGRIGVADLTGEPIGMIASGTLLSAYFQNPWDITAFLDGYLVSEPDSHILRYIDDSAVRSAAGSGKEGYLDAVGTKAQFSRPTGLATGENGEVYIADTDNGMIRLLDTEGNVTTYCSGLSEPTGLCWFDGVLYVAETGSHCISRIENGVRTVLAGMSGEEGYTDGLAAAARLRSPMGIAVGKDGTVYIADTGNGAVRQLRGGVVSTLTRSSESGTAVRPRSLMVTGNQLLVTDPFAKNLFTISPERETFTDVKPGSWYEDAVYQSVERGLFNGMGDGLFAPGGTTNRAMLAQMIANLQQQLDGDIIIAGSAALSDVSNDAWYSSVARWTVDLGVMEAKNGSFAPNETITREEMVTALWKFAGTLGADTSDTGDLTRYKDAGSISPNARDAMSWALAAGLVNGISTDELAPQGSTTRAQMVQVMIRFMELLQKP